MCSSLHWKGKVKHPTTTIQRVPFTLESCSVPAPSRGFQGLPKGVKKSVDEKRNPNTSPITNMLSRTEPNLHQLTTKSRPPRIPATAVKVRRTEREKRKFQHSGNFSSCSNIFSSFTSTLVWLFSVSGHEVTNKSIRTRFMHLT